MTEPVLKVFAKKLMTEEQAAELRARIREDDERRKLEDPEWLQVYGDVVLRTGGNVTVARNIANKAYAERKRKQ